MVEAFNSSAAHLKEAAVAADALVLGVAHVLAEGAADKHHGRARHGHVRHHNVGRHSIGGGAKGLEPARGSRQGFARTAPPSRVLLHVSIAVAEEGRQPQT